MGSRRRVKPKHSDTHSSAIPSVDNLDWDNSAGLSDIPGMHCKYQCIPLLIMVL